MLINCKGKKEAVFTITLLLACIISRYLSSIFYFEDIDSLRFALSASNYNILEARPHFPGYPVYCFLLIFIYNIIGNIGISFSIIGGISIFLIAIYCIKIISLYSKKINYFIALIVFINPFMWLMSNRYMPDIFGLSLLIIGIYFFLRILKFEYKKDYLILGAVLALLAGVRLSFIPFFIPIVFLFNNKKVIYLFISGLIFLLTWLIPLIYITGVEELINLFINDSRGHFFSWGGTVMSSNVTLDQRLMKIFEFTFVDGFSFWKLERNWITVINTILIAFYLYHFISGIKKHHFKSNIKEIKLILLCILSYFLWIYFFQNISYKARHILPFIPIICVILAISIKKLYNGRKYNKVITLLFITTHFYITYFLVNQHISPSAISQINKTISNEKNNNIVVVSDGLKNYFWNKSNNKNILFLNKNKINSSEIQNYINSGCVVYSSNKIENINCDFEILNFYHNPHVNRLWSHLRMYRYE